MERCRREIAAIEAEILAGNPDVEGLCLALSDWSVELSILEAEQRQEKPLNSSMIDRVYEKHGAVRDPRNPWRGRYGDRVSGVRPGDEPGGRGQNDPGSPRQSRA